MKCLICKCEMEPGTVPVCRGCDPSETLGELGAVSDRLHLDINGLHATMRATNHAYRNSHLCAALSVLIQANALARESMAAPPIEYDDAPTPASILAHPDCDLHS